MYVDPWKIPLRRLKVAVPRTTNSELLISKTKTNDIQFLH
jgi:hypothetical protein